MLKQTLIAGAALVLSAAPAFAYVGVNNNNAGVTVDSVTVANSGLNGVVSFGDSEAERVNVTSGNAVADATVGTEVNSNKVNVSGWGCVSVDNKGADVEVGQLTLANSGLNFVVPAMDSEVEHATVTSGDAKATSDTQTLVNVNDVKVTNSVE